MTVTGRIHSFESFGTLDGPGIRYIVFFQGCPLRCVYCHNPDTWSSQGGKEASVADILEKILSCRSFLRNGGVTLSGGEPLMQPAFARALLKACHDAGLHTALDTAGSLPLAQSQKVIDAADMLLLDIKALDDDLCLSLTGKNNKNTLATLDYCEKTKKRLWIRHVLVPELTLKEERLKSLAAFLNSFDCIERIELLPYHNAGAFKWHQLGLTFPLEKTALPSPEEVDIARRIIHHFAPRKKVF